MQLGGAPEADDITLPRATAWAGRGDLRGVDQNAQVLRVVLSAALEHSGLRMTKLGDCSALPAVFYALSS